MGHDRDPAPVARELLDSLGLDGVVQASLEAEACRRVADRRGVRFWLTVAQRLREMAHEEVPPPTSGPRRDAVSERALWRLMQRIEHFRHQAKVCETKAAAAAEPQRAELLEISRHWLELAAYAEVLAEPNRDTTAR